MKNIKNFAIIILIASTAFFIGAYTKKQEEVNAAHIIAETLREQSESLAEDAQKAMTEARVLAEMARKSQAEAALQVSLLQQKLEDCSK